jgi:hypothetical protein
LVACAVGDATDSSERAEFSIFHHIAPVLLPV